jgi:hypothetical protein
LKPSTIALVAYLLIPVLGFGWFFSYRESVKTKAVVENDQMWQERIEEFDKLARQRIHEVRVHSDVLAKSANALSSRQAAQVSDLMKKIDASSSSGTYMMIRDGKCYFTPEFIETFNGVRNTLPGGTQ